MPSMGKHFLGVTEHLSQPSLQTQVSLLRSLLSPSHNPLVPEPCRGCVSAGRWRSGVRQAVFLLDAPRHTVG